MSVNRQSLPASHRPPKLIGIAGGSAGGKSTLARHLHRMAGPGQATLLELDRFYLPKSKRRHRSFNFDHPSALDFSCFEQVLCDLELRGHSNVPVYDFVSHDRAGSETVVAAPLIIIEGLFALWHPPCRVKLHLKLFVDTPSDRRLARRIDRDQRERGRHAESVRHQWIESVLPMHDRFVEPTKSFADVIVDGCSDLERTASQLLAQISF